MRIERYEQAYECFVTPCIKYVYDKNLFGFYCIDLVWGRKGYSIQWGYKNTEK